MPRYTKDADAKIFKKRFKNLSHKSAAGVHAYMSQPKFRILQELAMHGLGYPTDFGESLPTHPKKKVKPSSFKFYAGAQNSHDIVRALTQEKINHDNPKSETHFGGGILDAVNTMGRWSFGLQGTDDNKLPDMNWTFDDLDANNIPDEIQNHINTLQQQMEGGDTTTPAPQTDDTNTPETEPKTDDDGNTIDTIVTTAVAGASGYAANAAKEAVTDVLEGAGESFSTWIMDILFGALPA